MTYKLYSLSKINTNQENEGDKIAYRQLNNLLLFLPPRQVCETNYPGGGNVLEFGALGLLHKMLTLAHRSLNYKPHAYSKNCF